MEEQAKYKVATVEQQTPDQLIALALEKNADPSTLSKLMDLADRWESRQARKAFVVAMTAFKTEAPAVIKKNDEVDFVSAKGRTRYSYANLGSIVQEITALLGKYGLSATWQTSQHENGNITVTCNITHSAGHRESVTLTGPPDDSGNKNRIQAIGSCVTYLQRYTLLAALGLATGEDDDNRDNDMGRREQQQPPLKEPQPQQHTTEGPPSASDSTDSQHKAIHAMLAKMGLKDDFAKMEWISKRLGLPEVITSTKELSKVHASFIIKELSAELDSQLGK